MDDDTKENDERSNMEEEEEKKMTKMEYKIRNDKKNSIQRPKIN